MRKLCRFLFFVLLLFSACRENKNQIATQLVKEWSGKEILFPVTLQFSSLGENVSSLLEKKWDYAIVSYTDSIGCTSCKLKLDKWKEFISLKDSIFEKRVEVLFFLHPSEHKEAVFLLKDYRFDYPVCIDDNDTFNKINNFPSNIAFQTFLIDNENKVLAIGNPIHNPKVKELYMNIIQGKTTTKEENTILTKIQVKETTLSLGRFNWQEEQKAQFMIYNVGKRPLVINDVTTSCGCTSVDYPKQPVRPGDSISLQVNYKADHPEHFDKTITVYCNTDPSLIQLKITGDAE